LNVGRIVYETVKYITMLSGLVLSFLLIGYYEHAAPKSPSEELFLPETVWDAAADEETENAGRQSILVPHCGDITYSLSTRKTDFSFSNPAENTCFLRVSITRRDTSETIFVSSLISPGKSVSDVTFFRDFSALGDYGAMVKIDAYRSDFGAYSLVNSMVIDLVIHVV